VWLAIAIANLKSQRSKEDPTLNSSKFESYKKAANSKEVQLR
jgi:hypothetical protein